MTDRAKDCASLGCSHPIPHPSVPGGDRLSERQFYLLAVDRTVPPGRGNEGLLVWWRPNGAGYTANLEDAGIYSEDDARRRSKPCCNADHVLDPIPVLVEDARELASTRTTVSYGSGLLDRFRSRWQS